MNTTRLSIAVYMTRRGWKGLLAGLLVAMTYNTDIVHAQNPSFAGQEFRRVWVGGTLPAGASEPAYNYEDVHITSGGVFINSQLFGHGLFYADDSGAYTVASTDAPEFSDAAAFRLMGRMDDGGLLFSPVSNLNSIPCQVYNGSGLNAVIAPTPGQSLNMGNYFDGRFVYLEHTGLGGTKVWYYSEGNPLELWFDNTVAGVLDYDDESLAYATGTTGDFDVHVRAPNGTSTHIIGNGDPLPGIDGETFTGTPAIETTEVDQGTVYLLGVGAAFPTQKSLFSSADGTTFDVIAITGQEVPGLAGITIIGMKLIEVNGGKIWLVVDQSDGDKVLYQIVGTVWTRVAGKNDSYDGRTPDFGFDVHEHSVLGDTVVIAVSFFDFSAAPAYNVTDLYVNGDLPGFETAVAGTVLELVPAQNGNWSISAMGEAGVTNTLLSTTSLTNSVWDTVGTIISDGSGQMEWTMTPTNNAQFFRLMEGP